MFVGVLGSSPEWVSSQGALPRAQKQLGTNVWHVSNFGAFPEAFPLFPFPPPPSTYPFVSVFPGRSITLAVLFPDLLLLASECGLGGWGVSGERQRGLVQQHPAIM